MRNERTEKANVQIQTSGGDTFNINEVTEGQTTEYQTVVEGNTVVTAVIQRETVSPIVTIFEEKDSFYSTVVQTGIAQMPGVDEE